MTKKPHAPKFVLYERKSEPLFSAAAQTNGFYRFESDELCVAIEGLVAEPQTAVLLLLHEFAHAQGVALKLPHHTALAIAERGRPILEREAWAWRQAVRLIRRHRPLTVVEKAHIRSCYGTYVRGYQFGA